MISNNEHIKTLSKMKILSVLIIIVFTTSSAIRVPSSWPKKQSVKQTNNYFNKATTDGSEIDFKTRPHGVRTSKHNSGRKYVPYNTRHLDLKTHNFKASAPANGWKPVIPYFYQNNNNFYDNNFKLPNFHLHKRENPQTKNYRDDSTHEPHYEVIKEEEKPLSKHEAILNIPTRPIYPGPGQWATKGIPHKPYIKPSEQTEEIQYDDEEEEEEEGEKPKGYEAFAKNKQLFDKQQSRFGSNLQSLPKKHNLGSYLPQSEESEDEYDDKSDDEESEPEFIPTKIYSQVRRSETESHHPQLEYDPRLREVIKDSKIQTVYSEEGYEDTAYDHAGHEKNAEESEGEQEFEKQIEKEKRRKAIKNEDSDAASSQQQPISTQKHNMIKTKQTKTTSVKDKTGGSAVEIASEIKTLSSLNNQETIEPFVKTFPKVYRYDKVESTTKSAIKDTTLQRFKRFVNDFPNIAVDTDFIDKINHNNPQKPQPFQKPKYPYYNNPNIHPDSPLRYAEDLDNIPEKTIDSFAFYNQADQKTECEEVQDDVNPIPDRIKKADENSEEVEDATDTQELVKGPRLKNLGDKIDCFKLKYFGENPLDSPIFKEELIGPVRNIFEDFKITEKRGVQDNTRFFKSKKPLDNTQINEIQKPNITVIPKPSGNNDPQKNSMQANILKDVIQQLKNPKIEATTIKNLPNIEIISTTKTENLENNQSESDVVSIITTPKYTINLQPKHIYHQIQLLEFLPPYESAEETTTLQTPEIKLNNTISTDEPLSTYRSPKNLVNPAENEDPKSEALRKRRRRPRPPWYRPTRYNIFDINRFLPSNPYKYLDEQSSTILPQHDALSEVHYKDEIKPSEQFAVFTDVINIIKNSTKDSMQTAASSNNMIATKLNLFDNFKHKSFRPFNKYKNAVSVGEVLDSYLPSSTVSSLTTTTSKPVRGTIKYKDQQDEAIHNKERKKYENLELLKVKRKELNSHSSTKSKHFEDSKASSSNVEESENFPEVFGLMPPGTPDYKTIHQPEPTKPTVVKPIQAVPEPVVEMNTFYVLGMKPPSPKQKVIIYSDFKTMPYVKPKYPFVRHKRSAQRPAYSEVSRNRNKPIVAEENTDVALEEEDDYVPHRPKNYHYDEETGRIVYDKVENKQPEEENIEYVEVTDAPLPKPTRKNVISGPKFANFTGPSYIDFVKKLKNHPNYEAITDPPTTEKGKEEATTSASTTIKYESTTPPAFLSILSKVREDASYKFIEDKTTKKSTTTTTEEPIIEEGEEEEESQLGNVQNSPGGQNHMQNFQIFDINDYLPKVKNYTPRTSIDYSKYKTIQRPTVSTTQESLTEDDNFEEKKSSHEASEKKESENSKEVNPVVSESKQKVVSSSTTQATVAAVTSTKKPNRRRGTRRPSSKPSSVITEDTSALESLPSKNDKPKRTYPRRQRTRIKIASTTEESELDSDETTKIVRRRHQRTEDIPLIKSPNDLVNSNETNKPIQQRLRKIEDAQVFQHFDENKKHGGNYKKENDKSESKQQQKVTRLTDVVAKPRSYFTDAKLPSNVNQLKEVEIEDEITDDTTEDYSVYNDDEVEETIATTKRPQFIKDPDKRLYYYAPI